MLLGFYPAILWVMTSWDDPFAAFTEAAPKADPEPVASLAPASAGSLPPVRAADKRIVNGEADVNQLMPFKYEWAWDYYLKGTANHWTPLEIPMGHDVQDYHQKLTPAEQHVVVNVLAYLTTADVLAMRNVGIAVMEKMTAPELQMYQARQVYEEALHSHAYQHLIETLGLDQGEVYNRYRVVPEIYGKIKMANDRLHAVLESQLDLRDRETLRTFLESYLFFAAVFEGAWFYNGFSPIFALQRRNLMKGTAEQLQYIIRDEALHAAFGLQVCKTLMQEEGIQPDPARMQRMFEEAEAREKTYISYILQRPILGYNADDHAEQFRYLCNWRMRTVGLPEPFPGAENRLPWLSEQVQINKEQNFFERRVTEYQSGGALRWD